MKRRSFLQWAGLSGISGLFAGGASCSSDRPTASNREATETDRSKKVAPYSEKDGYHFMRPHNWALLAWAEDIIQGKLPSSGNVIFHTDAHHDVHYRTRGPKFAAQFGRAVELNVSKAARRVERISDEFIDIFKRPDHYSDQQKMTIAEKEAENTNIGNFIIKAFAAGITDEVYWARPAWDFTLRKGPGTTFYALQRIDDELYQVHKTDNYWKLANAEKILTVHQIDAEAMVEYAKESPSCIWDVDLDYFSCSGDGADEWVSIKKLAEMNSKIDQLREQYGSRFAVQGEFKDLVDFGFDIQKLQEYYGPRFKVKGEFVRNPLVSVYRATDQEIAAETRRIRDVEKELPTDRPYSKTLAVSPRFTYDDQEELLIGTYFQNI